MRRIVCGMLCAYLLAINMARADGVPVAERLDQQNYESGQSAKGVVLFAVRWDRRWKCGEFQSAQLQRIAFDRLPSAKANADEEADLLVEDAPLIMTKPVFENYAYLVEPGEYALSGFRIKVARSMSDVGSFTASRTTLLKGGKPEGGTFTVSAGEVVYIGHFYLDCYKQPTLWRYYAKGKNSFDSYLQDVQKKYPMLDAKKAQFRLFKTTTFGEDYQLPSD